MNSPLLEALAERVLVFDGAMGTQLQAADLRPEDFQLPESSDDEKVQAARERLGDKALEGCSEILSLTRPDVVQGIHERYLAAGADLIETNTFGSTSIVLGEYEVPELVYTCSLASARLARQAANKFTDRRRFVVGALGPGTKLEVWARQLGANWRTPTRSPSKDCSKGEPTRCCWRRFKTFSW